MCIVRGPREVAAPSAGLPAALESPHETAPGKLAGRQCANDALGRMIESLDINNVGRQLALQKISNLLIEHGSLDLRRIILRSRQRKATRTKNAAENWSDRSCRKTSFAHGVQASMKDEMDGSGRMVQVM